MADPDLTKNFETLTAHWHRVSGGSIQNLFDTESDRFSKYSVRFDELLFDFSKQHIDDEAFAALCGLPEVAGLDQKRDAMLSGSKINTTEGRSVLHTALRATPDQSIYVDGENVVPAVHEVLDRALAFAESIRAGDTTVSGGRITDVVNIGIGGSDLGPKMAVRALAPFVDGPECHFVSNVDGADLSDTVSKLDLSTTLFIIASKSFSTQETMLNARSAFEMVASAVGADKAASHFCAVSTNLEATRKFGIPDERTFGFWDWVGGRFSVWSAIGLPMMIALGPDRFQDFLAGARSADEHFVNAPTAQNIPVLMALLGVWNRNIADRQSQAVLVYDDRMPDFSRWLQQLDMESNGKQVTVDGADVTHKTAPVIFGEPGTNGQHAFYQMLHQGSDIVPCDFLIAANGHEVGLKHHHQILLANCFAQSEALMRGRGLEEADGNVHGVFEGDRPSSTLLYRELNPRQLGQLMALYEHKIFVQGVLWGINSFDQWGVELGKELANSIEPAIAAGDAADIENVATRSLVSAALEMKDS